MNGTQLANAGHIKVQTWPKTLKLKNQKLFLLTIDDQKIYWTFSNVKVKNAWPFAQILPKILALKNNVRI